MSESWRTPVNQLLHGLMYEQEITEEMVRWTADAAVKYTSLSLGPAVYYEAIQEALSTGEQLDGLQQLPQFDQVRVAQFLRAVADQLDASRPWAAPKFEPINDPGAAWKSFGPATPIARLDLTPIDITNSLRTVFRPITEVEPRLQLLMVKLNTGETVAIQGTYRPGDEMTLLCEAAFRPDEVIEHFTAATGIPRSKIQPMY